NTANWSTFSGGPGGASVPGPGNTAVFNGNGIGNCNVNQAVNVARLIVNDTYTGTINHNNFVFTVSGPIGAVINGGTFSGGTERINVVGPLTIDGGNFISTSDTLRLSSNFSLLSGSFNHNNGAVRITDEITINATPNLDFFDLILQPITANAIFQLNTDINILNNLVYNGIYAIAFDGDDIFHFGDTYLLSSNASNLNFGNSTIHFVSSSDQTIFGTTAPLLAKLVNVHINKPAGSLIVQDFVSLGWEKDFMYTSGTLTGPGTWYFFRNVSVSGIPFEIENVAFSSQGSNSSHAINTNFTITNELTLTGNQPLSLNLGTIFLEGDLFLEYTSGNGGGSGTVVFSGTGNQTSNSAVAPGISRLPNVTIDKPAGNLEIIGNTSIAGTWEYVQGDIIGNGFVFFASANDINGPNHIIPNIGFAARTGNATFNVNADITVPGNFSNEGFNRITLEGGNIYVSGDVFINNTSASPNAGGTTNLHILGNTNQSFISTVEYSRGKLPNVIIDKPAGTLTLNDTIAIGGSFDYFNGTVDAISGNSFVSFHTLPGYINATTGTNSLLFNDVDIEGTPEMISDLHISNTINFRNNRLRLNSNRLVIFNDDPNAILRQNGHIASETNDIAGYGEVEWFIGDGIPGQTYQVPFGALGSTAFFPLNFEVTNAGSSTNGSFVFATYPTDVTQNPNNRPFPTGVNNTEDFTGAEAAEKFVDRYWIIEPQNYTSLPEKNVTFTYRDSEWDAIGGSTNSINEANLKAVRWDASNNFWTQPFGTVNTALNRVTANGIDEYGVYSLADIIIPEFNISSTDTIICAGDCVDFSPIVPAIYSPTGYSWSFPGAATTSSTQQNPTNICFNAAGSYDVILTVEFPNGEITTTFEDFITTFPNPLADAGTSQTVCQGGTVTLNGSGGVSYSWSPGNLLNDSTLQNPQATVFNTTTFTLTVTDNNGCQNTDDVIVNVTPSTLDIELTIIDSVSCNGDNDATVQAVISGGTAPFDLTWSTGDVVNGTTNLTHTLSGLGAGNFDIFVTDAQQCGATDDIDITEPDSLIAEILNFTDVSCNGLNDGSATVDISGGTAPYDILWSDIQQTQTATNLSAGLYTVDITDFNGCQTTADVVISEPAELVVTEGDITDVTCPGDNDGSASIIVSGGNGPYVYEWSDAQTDSIAINLTAGNYTVTVTDANLCEEILNVVVGSPDPINISVLATDSVSCFGLSDGSVTVDASGGQGGLTYSWNDSGNQTGATASNLPAGSYTVTVTDQEGCFDTLSVSVFEPLALSASLVSTSDLTCFGSDDGEIEISITGGTQPYAVLWDDPAGQNTTTATSLEADTYTATITDTNGCQTTISGTVASPDSLNAQITNQVNVSVNGLNDGSATVTPTGGVSPYSYSWNTTPPQADSTAIDLPAGTYTVTVTDANGCTDTASVIISEPPPLIVDVTDTVMVSCNGFADGSATVTPVGGVEPYTYTWNTTPVQNDSIAVNLTAGIYEVTVVDDNGVTAIVQVEITEPDAINLTTISEDISCFGDNNGVAEVVPSGGTTPYTFLWDNIETTAEITNLAGGTYTVIVTDANLCEDSISVTIAEPAELTASTITVDDVTCFGFNNGLIITDIEGGTLPYNYDWNHDPALNDSIAENLIAGNYNLTVTDSNACVTTLNVDINEPSELILSIGDISDVSCGGLSDGSASVIISGGVQPYSPVWNDPPSTTDSVISGVPAGIYTVIVTDGNGCVDSLDFTITEPPVLSVQIDSVSDISCFNAGDGVIYSTVLGGSSPYTIAWNDPATQDTEIASNLDQGTYTITVIDDNGCQATDSASIAEPDELIINLLSLQDITCSGFTDGSISVEVLGGTAPYTYAWDDSALQDSSTAVNLGDGIYTLTVTDDNGCTETYTDTITEPQTLDIVLLSQDNVSCGGLSDGSATIGVTGGTLPYTYLWDDASATADSILTGVPADTYTVTVTDSSGCSDTFQVTITEPDPVAASIIDSTDISCFGANDGFAEVLASGGSGIYTYSWDDPLFQDSTVAINLAPGVYTVTVTDDNNCETTASVQINEPDSLVASIINFTDVSCFGLEDGTAEVGVTGGTGPYSYAWLLGQTDSVVNDLAQGAYTVTVTDANGCTDNAQVIISEPSAVLASIIETQDLSCFGADDGSATIAVSGGTTSTGSFTYQWNDPDAQFDSIVFNLPSGAWEVVVSDDNNCTDTLTVNISEPDSIFIDVLSITDVSCFGLSDGSALVEATGGIGSIVYVWSDPDLTQGSLLDSVSAGIYTVVATDSNACSNSLEVEIQQPGFFDVEITDFAGVTCFGFNDGFAVVTPSGGVQPYTYEWSDTQTDSVASNLLAGQYTVQVTDDNNCTLTDTVTIPEPDELTVNIDSFTDITCFGADDGTAQTLVSGGSQPYTYNWTDPMSQTTADAVDLPAGTFSVFVSDSSGCQASSSVTIAEPDEIVISLTSKEDVSCFGLTDGSATVSASGGTGTLNYNWMPGNLSGPSIDNLAADTYTLTVTDDSGCTETLEVEIEEPGEIVADVSILENASCYGGQDGEVELTVSGGVFPVSIASSTGDTIQFTSNSTHVFSNVAAGNYLVVIVDNNGCTANTNFTVGEKDNPDITNTIVENATCSDENGTITIELGGASAPYTFDWSHDPALNNQIADLLAAGSYQVTVTNDFSCDTILSFDIIDEEAPVISAVDMNPSLCGNDNGVISLTVDGGTGDLNYNWGSGLNNSPVISNLEPGDYEVIITDENGCTETTSVSVTEIDAPFVSLSPASPDTIIPGASVQIETDVNSFSTDIVYSWEPSTGLSCTDCPDPLATPSANTTYDLIVTDVETGCFTISQFAIIVKDEIFIPNAITPNGDGINDSWNIRELRFYPDNEVVILTRWGDEVFRRAPYDNSFNGTYSGRDLPEGTYYYIIRLKATGEVLTGPLTILR
ncbi:MAG: hypothetical protein EA412_05685, partial [Chitinophagaceae bacterium]